MMWSDDFFLLFSSNRYPSLHIGCSLDVTSTPALHEPCTTLCVLQPTSKVSYRQPAIDRRRLTYLQRRGQTRNNSRRNAYRRLTPTTSSAATSSTGTVVFLASLSTGPFHLPSVCRQFMQPSQCVACSIQVDDQRAYMHASIGYATYAWAKSYDEWQNSKAAHAHGHEH